MTRAAPGGGYSERGFLFPHSVFLSRCGLLQQERDRLEKEEAVKEAERRRQRVRLSFSSVSPTLFVSQASQYVLL